MYDEATSGTDQQRQLRLVAIHFTHPSAGPTLYVRRMLDASLPGVSPAVNKPDCSIQVQCYHCLPA